MTRIMTYSPRVGSKLPDLVQASYHHLGNARTNSFLEKTVYPLYCGSNDNVKLDQLLRALRGQNIKTILHLASESPELYNVHEYTENLSEKINYLQPGDIVAIKLTSFYQKYALFTENTEITLLPDLDALIRACLMKDLYITIDAEESELNSTIIRVVHQLMQKYNKNCVRILATYQCYLKNTINDIISALEEAKTNNYYFGAKLVRGAYLEYEREKDNDCPCWETIEETAQCFLDAVDLLVTNKCPIIVASHNNEAIRTISSKYHKEQIKYAQLLGLNDQLTQYCVNHKLNVYKFVPYGPSEVVVPYLLRRLQENRDLLQHAGK